MKLPVLPGKPREISPAAMRAGSFVLVALLLAAAAGAEPVAPPTQPELRTVERVDLARYVGRWYEIAKYPNRFQAQCARNTSATYAPAADGRIAVVNRCERADGSEDLAQGVARIVDAQSQAKLQVSFLPAWLRELPVGWGNYWVIELAPDYSLAVVGEPSRNYLWVLARTPTIDAAEFERVRARLPSHGYDPERLERSVQEP